MSNGSRTPDTPPRHGVTHPGTSPEHVTARRDQQRLIDIPTAAGVSAAGGQRTLCVDLPGYKVLHLCLAPGQRMPLHDHVGCHVTILGLTGTTSVTLDDRIFTVEPHQLLSFPGESLVSPGNDSDAACAALISLVERPATAA